MFLLIAVGFNAFDPTLPPFRRWQATRPGIVFGALMVAVACVLSGGPRSPLSSCS